MGIAQRIQRLEGNIPDVSAVTAANADLVLTRVRVEAEERRGVVQKASVGLLKIGSDGSCWPCVENISTQGQNWNWLRRGPYKVRMYKRKNEILQIAAPWWGQHLIHPTSNWRSLRGCISIGDVFDEYEMSLENSGMAHGELMTELGPFELHKEFTLFVENNPEEKNPNAAREAWVAGKLRKKIRKIKGRR